MGDDTPAGRSGWVRGRAAWLVGAVAAAVVAAAAGTLYVTVLRPDVETVVSGQSRLDIQLLTVGEFQPAGMVHSGAVLIPDGGVDVSEVPANARAAADYGGYLTWATEHGGVPLETLPLQVTVRARTDTPVIINGIETTIVSRADPLAGWYRFPDIACGGVDVRQFQIDLDAQRPRTVLAPPGETPRPATDVYRVTSDDPEVFQIRARTRSSDVRFSLALRYQSEAGSGLEPIGEFRVTALHGQQAYDAPVGSSELAPTEFAGTAFGC